MTHRAWNPSLALLLVWSLLPAGSAWPQGSEGPPTGVRASGLAGAFVGVADDATATVWNPAGISRLEQHELHLTHTDLFGTGLRHSFVAYVIPLFDRFKPGLSWGHLGFDDGELNYGRDLLTLSSACKLTPRLSLGANLKYLRTSSGLDGRTFGEGSGIGVDLAALAQVTDRLRVGVLGGDITQTGVEYSGGGSQTVHPRRLRVGVSYGAPGAGRLALDVGRSVSLGAELWPLGNRCGLRGGAERGSGGRGLTVALGASLRHKSLQLDYAFRRVPNLPATHRYGLSFHFELFASDIVIKDAHFEAIYPAYYHRYGEGAPVRIVLENKSEEDIDADITVRIPDMQAESSLTGIFVPAQTPQPYALPLRFSDSVLGFTQNRVLTATVSVVYKDRKRTRTEEKTYPVRVFKRNAVRWERIDVAAAFVTSEDPNVAHFASQLVHTFSNEVRGRLYDRNLLKAMLIFDALKAYGIRYVKDPLTPFNAARGGDVLDEIKYPSEALARKLGDCDDATALYAALLENVGVATALVDAPAHIFVMFSSGIPASRSQFLGLPDHLTVTKDGELWIPVEITMIDKSFMEAWRVGAMEMQEIGAERARRTSDAWQEYPAHQPPFERTVALPAMESVGTAFRDERSELWSRRRTYVESEYLGFHAADPDAFAPHHELAMAYAYAGLSDDAVRISA